MIKKLLELLYKALEKMVGYKSITDAFDLNDSIISDKMSDSMELWKAMYKDESPWLDESAGIYSLGLAKQICQSLQQQTLSEMETSTRYLKSKKSVCYDYINKKVIAENGE